MAHYVMFNKPAFKGPVPMFILFK